MDRFRIVQTLVQAIQVGIAAGLAAGAGDAPIYRLPSAVVFGLVIASAVVSVISANLPSWQASPAVSRAAATTEAPQNEHVL